MTGESYERRSFPVRPPHRSSDRAMVPSWFPSASVVGAVTLVKQAANAFLFLHSNPAPQVLGYIIKRLCYSFVGVSIDCPRYFSCRLWN